MLGAIQEYGVPGAVDFCHIEALPITDSMSTHYGARIRRVSDRPRNPGNAANAEELAYIEALKAAKSKGEDLPPMLQEEKGLDRAYFAIESNDMCLKCHGQKGADIADETWQSLRERYPDDKAFGYGSGEIRGIFVVEIPQSVEE